MRTKLIASENKNIMTGLFHSKYHIAVYDENKDIIRRITETLKRWFSNKVIIESYTNSYDMFIGINLAKANNKPFDMTIIGPDEGQETVMILKWVDSNMGIINLKDENSLKKDTVKLALRHHRIVNLPL